MTRWISLAILIIAVILGTILMYVFKSHQEPSLNSTSNVEPILPATIEKWHEFTAPEGQFKVLMPSLPHHAKESNQEFKSNEMRLHELYVANKDDGTLFTVYLITFPERKKAELNSGFLLKFIKEMLSSNQDNKIQNIEPVTFNKSNAVDFSVENNQAMVDGKAFIKDNTVYVLSTTAKIDNRNKKEFEFFINSFELGSATKSNGQQPVKLSK